MNDMQNINGQTGYVASKEMVRRSDYYSLLQAAKEGDVIKIKRGLYASEEELSKLMIDTDKVVPGGVLCLYSAWFIHHLSTQIPTEHCLAVRRGRKIVLPDYPPVKLYWWAESAYSTGIIEMEIEEFSVKVYDMEKSVCDAVRFRNKIGIDVCSEIVHAYLGKRERNIDKLMKYANVLRVGKTMKTYLEILL